MCERHAGIDVKVWDFVEVLIGSREKGASCRVQGRVAEVLDATPNEQPLVRLANHDVGRVRVYAAPCCFLCCTLMLPPCVDVAPSHHHQPHRLKADKSFGPYATSLRITRLVGRFDDRTTFAIALLEHESSKLQTLTARVAHVDECLYNVDEYSCAHPYIDISALSCHLDAPDCCCKLQ
jgi:hypothetical protein